MRPLKGKPKRKRRRFFSHYGVGVTLEVTYTGGLDHEKDAAVRKALGLYGNGSGYSFAEGTRDHSAIVPERKLPRVLAMLRKIRGVKTKRLVQRWVLCR